MQDQGAGKDDPEAMTLTLTDDQKMIRDEAARFLADRASRAAVRARIEAGGGTDAALWRTMAQELGWCAMAIPEDVGGLGLGPTELVLLLERAGAALAPVPLWSTACLAAPLIAAAAPGAAPALLARIAGGEIAATVALADPGAADGGAVRVTARRSGDGYVLSGAVDHVIDLPAADLVLLPARLGDGTALFALARGEGTAIALPVMDATRPVGRLHLDGIALSAAARIDEGGLAPGALALALDHARLGLAAEQVGAAQALAEMTLAYLRERVQFGRTLASFQAIKHRCALIQVDLAEARSLLLGAAAGFASRPAAERAMEIAALKALADELARKAAREAIQMHGGVAMTWEYDPHFWFKRVQASSALLGQSDDHLERIAAALLDGEGA